LLRSGLNREVFISADPMFWSMTLDGLGKSGRRAG
jgi:hypothetical protein